LNGTKTKQQEICQSTEFHLRKPKLFLMIRSNVDFYDPDHSDDEERYLIVGESNQGRLLIVSYTERGDVIRLISARVATRAEREAYEEG